MQGEVATIYLGHSENDGNWMARSGMPEFIFKSLYSSTSAMLVSPSA